MESPDPRKIIHIDMDAFFASVEQRDNPALRGRPVIVGGPPEERGVVSTCSYEARKFGVHSAMASSRALKLCPQGIFLRPRFDAYMEASSKIRAIFACYTDLIEPLSLDEAFLDVTENRTGHSSATATAREILTRIREVTGLSASAGVSCNKFLAKVASDYRKPAGLTVVVPERAGEFLAGLPIRKFFGVGKVTEKRMHELGIRQGRDLLRFSLAELCGMFGKSGEYFYWIARGVDTRPVEPERERKSIGREHTFARDLADPAVMVARLEEIAAEVAAHLDEEGVTGRTVTLKIRFHDFRSITRSRTLPSPVREAAAIHAIVRALFARTQAAAGRPVRLLGISVSGFEGGAPSQLEFSFF